MDEPFQWPAAPQEPPRQQPYQQPQYQQQPQWPAPKKRHILRNILIVLVVLGVVGAVIGGTQGGKETTASTLGALSHAQPAPPALLEILCSGPQEGITMAPVRGAVVRSDDYEEVYFVAMEFSANGVENQVGVWSTNDLAGNGLISAVDRTAEAFTVWPYGGGGVSMDDDGAEEAKAAVQGP
jgi:hypothetical protein